MDLTTLRFQRFKRFTQKCFYSDGFNQYLDNGGSLENVGLESSLSSRMKLRELEV